MCSRETTDGKLPSPHAGSPSYDRVAQVDRAQQDRARETTISRLVREFYELPAGQQAAFMVLVNMKTQLSEHDREVCRMALHQNMHTAR